LPITTTTISVFFVVVLVTRYTHSVPSSRHITPCSWILRLAPRIVVGGIV
jgi:hypothetical protein